MAIFNKFPFTNTHELNLDWILRQLKDLLRRVKHLEESGGGGGGGGTDDYNELGNKPSINGVTLEGNKTSAQLNIPVDVRAEITRALNLYDPAKADYAPPYAVGTLGYAIENAAIAPEDVQDAVDAYLDAHPALTGMFTNAAKNALLNLLEKVAYIDQNGQAYLEQLRTLLAATVVSISATFTQGASVVYDTDSLDSLKQYLVVTATYSDGTTGVLLDSAYTLSGTLTSGTSTITVTCGDETDTFTVAVTHGFLYTPDKGLLTAQSYVSSSNNATDSGTETIDNNGLKFHCNSRSGSTKAWIIQMADFDAATSGRMTIQFYLTSIGTITQANTTTPGTIMFQVFDGVTGGVVGGLAKHGNTAVPLVRETIGTGVSWTAQGVSYDEWHELVIEYSDGKQSVSLDSTPVFSDENPATTTGYFAHTGLRLMETTTVLNMYIRKIEVTIE